MSPRLPALTLLAALSGVWGSPALAGDASPPTRSPEPTPDGDDEAARAALEAAAAAQAAAAGAARTLQGELGALEDAVELPWDPRFDRFPPESAGLGSVQVLALTPDRDRAWLDGELLLFDQRGGFAFAYGVPPGEHSLVIRRDGRYVVEQRVAVLADANLRCARDGGAPRWNLPCATTRPALMLAEGRMGALSPEARPAAALPPEPMDPRDFEALRAAVDRASFADEQLAIVGASRGYVTADQLAALMREFSFNTDRLAGARLLAARVVDPEDLGAAEDTLTFSEDRAALRALFDPQAGP